MNQKYEVLFTPTKIGKVEIKNRFVMCAMAGTHVIDGILGNGYDEHVHDFLIDRAKDGVGLIIPGSIALYSFMKNGTWLYEKKEVFNGVDELIDEIHTYGSKVFFQLSSGMGRNMLLTKNYEDELGKYMDLDRICDSITLQRVWCGWNRNSCSS